MTGPGTPPPPPLDRAAFDALSLDVGGVLMVPDHGIVGQALTRAGLEHDRSRFLDAHYVAMAEIDRMGAAPERWREYGSAFLGHVGIGAGDLDAGRAALATVLDGSVWHQPVPGARAALARLSAAGLRLAVTSNSDGHLADMLLRYECVQVGPGAGIPVEHISDSGVVGVHKPDPGIFHATAAGLGLPPGRVCHIGDAGTFDADGAEAAGMLAVHVDPLRLCPDGHVHVRSLADFADRLLGAREGSSAQAAPAAQVT
jgi:putative hydrolase of the HAD superfamily